MSGLDAVGGHVSSVGERTRRELGTWPSADSIVEQLVATLREAGDQEPDPARKSRLATAASVLGDTARQIAVAVISAKLGGL